VRGLTGALWLVALALAAFLGAFALVSHVFNLT
jgi:hypothetical protein